MEKLFKLRTKDGHNIHGILNFKNRLPNKCVIFVHGLTGKPNNHWFYNAKNYFVQKGYAVIRFYLYTDLPQARQLDQCTLAIHSQDLNQVIDYARRKGFKSLSLVGHSLGGPTILNAKTKNLSSLVFWDPLFNPQQFIKDVAIFDKQMNAYILKWGVTHILGKPMYQELCNVTHYTNQSLVYLTNTLPHLLFYARRGHAH